MSLKIGDYEHGVIDQITHDRGLTGNAPLTSAQQLQVEELSRLEARVVGAPHLLQDHYNDVAAADDKQVTFWLNEGKTGLQFATGVLPTPAAPIASLGGVGAIVDYFNNPANHVPQPTIDPAVQDHHGYDYVGGYTNEATYNYASSLVRDGHVPQNLQPFIDHTQPAGTPPQLRRLESLSSEERQALEGAVRDDNGGAFIDSYGGNLGDAYTTERRDGHF
ncbi:hypothetical protein [Fodinicola feengrottensis]|uniref:hypothetical protein n=1 Tax=Fodinicola feengrottensis TaxID=435914 RepID=UPI0013D2BFA3|nr:hypothetical protein [Fodinicola feengrottensis]